MRERTLRRQSRNPTESKSDQGHLDNLTDYMKPWVELLARLVDKLMKQEKHVETPTASPVVAKTLFLHQPGATPAI